MDLSTSYLGLSLKNPVLCSSCTVSQEVDNVKRLEDAGAGAVVMYSLFEEQINREQEALDHYLTYGSESFAEALTYFPEPEEYFNADCEEYLGTTLFRSLSFGHGILRSTRAFEIHIVNARPEVKSRQTGGLREPHPCMCGKKGVRCQDWGFNTS